MSLNDRIQRKVKNILLIPSKFNKKVTLSLNDRILWTVKNIITSYNLIRSKCDVTKTNSILRLERCKYIARTNERTTNHNMIKLWRLKRRWEHVETCTSHALRLWFEDTFMRKCIVWDDAIQTCSTILILFLNLMFWFSLYQSPLFEFPLDFTLGYRVSTVYLSFGNALKHYEFAKKPSGLWWLVEI